MEYILDYLIDPYRNYSYIDIALESTACFTGILSVFYAIRKNILVFPIGIISTTLYTYLLYQWVLYGDMLINGYYTIMSIYGWIQWSHKVKETSYSHNYPSTNNYSVIVLWTLCFSLVLGIYVFRYGSPASIPIINYIDSLVSSFFLVAMYLMARMDIRNWHFWILGNLISIPLFLVKGYGITAFQYLIFFILAIKGWSEWTRKK